MKIQADEKVSQIAIEVPETVQLMERFGIRFYDSKPLSLEEACKKVGVPLDVMLQYLEHAAAPQNGGMERWDFAPLPALVRFILDNHHAWERHRVTELLGKLETLAKEDGERFHELVQLRSLFNWMSKGFLGHMKREEHELFPPFLHEVAPGGAQNRQAKAAHDLLPLTEMLTQEHDDLLTQWEAMRLLTGNFKAPEGATEAHREVLLSFIELEGYQHQHIHKENFILFEKIRVMALKR